MKYYAPKQPKREDEEPVRRSANAFGDFSNDFGGNPSPNKRIQAMFDNIQRSIDEKNAKRTQPKLTIGEPNDKYEKDADRTAETVMSKLTPVPSKMPRIMNLGGLNHPLADISKKEMLQMLFAPDQGSFDTLKEQAIQRQGLVESDSAQKANDGSKDGAIQPSLASPPTSAPAKLTDEEEEKKVMQKMVDKGVQQSPITRFTNLEATLRASRGGGQPMPEELRIEMETRFGGLDFSQVRIHTDSDAQRMCVALHARAFTSGHDIYFNAGQWDPASKAGKTLLAHELTHTVHQGATKGVIQREADGEEAEVQMQTEDADVQMQMEDAVQMQEASDVQEMAAPEVQMQAEVADVQRMEAPEVQEQQETDLQMMIDEPAVQKMEAPDDVQMIEQEVAVQNKVEEEGPVQKEEEDVQRKKIEISNGEQFWFRTKYIPEMDSMSREELAAYCFSKATGVPINELLDLINSNDLVLSGDWQFSPEEIKENNGYIVFFLTDYWLFRLTGFVSYGSEAVEGFETKDLPEGPLSNAPSDQATENTGSNTGGAPKVKNQGIGTGNEKGKGSQMGTPSNFGEGRGGDNRRAGAEDRDAYYETLPKEEQIDVVNKANARFNNLFGFEDGFQLTKSDPEFLKKMWLEKRDEALIEKLSLERLPEGLKKMFDGAKEAIAPEKVREWNQLLHALNQLDETQLETLDLLLHSGDQDVPVDYEELKKLAEMMDDFTSMDYMEYMSIVSSEAKSIEDFRISLEKYLERKEDKKEENEHLEEVKTKLFGLEDLYVAYKEFKKKESKHNRGPNYFGDGMDRKVDRMIHNRDEGAKNRIEKKRELLMVQMQENGFESIREFETYIDDYEKSFAQFTVRIAEDHLLKYRHILYEEWKKLKDDAYLDQLLKEVKKSGAKGHYKAADEASSMAGNISYQEDRFIPGMMESKGKYQQEASSQRGQGKTAIKNTVASPLVQEEQFDHETLAYQESKADIKEQLSEYINEKIASINEAWADIHTEPDYIYELDTLFSSSLEAQQITDDSIYGMILKDKKAEIDDANLIKTIGIIFLAVVLTIVTLGAAAPFSIGAGIASLGLSLYTVYEAAEDYKQKKDGYNVGLLTDDPSLIWVVLAIAGAVFDVGALSAAFKAAGPISKATKVFNETGDLVALEKQLSEISELTAKMRSNILKSAEAEAQANKMIKSVLTPQAGMVKMAILPGGEEFARLVAAAYYMTKKGVIDFQSYLLKLKAEKIIDDIGALTTKEKLILKDAFDQGKILQTTSLGSSGVFDNILALSMEVPKKWKKMFMCKQYASDLKSRMITNGESGIFLEIRTGTGFIESDKFGSIATSGVHQAILVDDIVFDNLRPGGILYSDWISDLGGRIYTNPPHALITKTPF